ncbi:hypothetical protein GE061_013081 [Apolygus lucorum]|uniref:Peptidase S1 domain-containing protein n=1 Tax=Apolygus lucorum TaxID=248454 RepID=A0A6A4JT94_APOLU|nr:hypothetical protein GE061_013081 [Apolygus lucorum]
MWWLIKWTLLMPLSSVLAGKSGTPPPYVPPDKGPPKDFNNCRLNGMSPVSWIVSVWDTAENVIVGHGSLFTYIAFVSTCRQYSKSPSSYIAHGQNIWDVKQPTNPCMQQKEVETIIKHPNCSKEISHFPFSDFSVFKLKKPFEIAGHHYPMMALPDSQEDHMDDITYINTINDPKGCFLASFMDQEKKMPIFNLEVNMKIIPFQKNCVKLMCEWNPSDKEKCEKQFKQTGHENDTSTMICAKNSTEAKIVLGKSNSYWLAGAPFLCNGSTYGIASVPVMR